MIVDDDRHCNFHRILLLKLPSKAMPVAKKWFSVLSRSLIVGTMTFKPFLAASYSSKTFLNYTSGPILIMNHINTTSNYEIVHDIRNFERMVKSKAVAEHI